MSEHINLIHNAGLCYDADSTLLFRKIVKEGLKSRQFLINSGVLPRMSV